MRISTRDNDGSDILHMDPLAHPINVYLDGVEQTNCTMADTVKGVVRVATLDVWGEVHVEPGTDYIAEHEKRGRVTVVLKANDRG